MSITTEPSHILTADEIWAAKDIEERTVLVPQWGGSVRIRTFSKRQADEMRKRATLKDKAGKEYVDSNNLEALLFCEGVIEPHFDVEQYGQLEEKSAVAIGVILKAIMDASGLSELAVAEADKSNGARPDVALRVLPGKRTRDDTSGTVAADVSQ